MCLFSWDFVALFTRVRDLIVKRISQGLMSVSSASYLITTLALVSLCSNATLAASVTVIEVFTVSNDPVNVRGLVFDKDRIVLNYYILDRPYQIEKVLRLNVANNLVFDRRIIMQRLENSRLLDEILHSYRAIHKAKIYGLTKLPALVFNGKQVIYGVRKIHQAVLIFRKLSRLHGN